MVDPKVGGDYTKGFGCRPQLADTWSVSDSKGGELARPFIMRAMQIWSSSCMIYQI